MSDDQLVVPVNGYANVTLDYYLPVWSLSLSMANAVFYLICYSIYLVALVIFLRRFAQKTNIKRNHKVLFFFAVLSVVIQSLNLIIRIVYDAMHVEAREIAELGQLVRWDYYVALQTMGGLSAFFMYINFVGLFQIMFFVQKMFWNTAGIMRAISKETNKKLIITINVINAIFTTAAIIVIFAVSIFFGAKKFNIVSRNITTVVFVAGFLIILVMLVFCTIMAITSGVLVIRTIKATTRKVLESRQFVEVDQSKTNIKENNQGETRSSMEFNVFEKRVTSPFKITFGLLLGLCLCVLVQLVSIAVASTAAILENFKVIWHFFNCLGVLIFAVLVLFLFYPLFLHSENALKEIEKRRTVFLKLENLKKVKSEILMSEEITLDSNATTSDVSSPIGIESEK